MSLTLVVRIPHAFKDDTKEVSVGGVLGNGVIEPEAGQK